MSSCPSILACPHSFLRACIQAGVAKGGPGPHLAQDAMPGLRMQHCPMVLGQLDHLAVPKSLQARMWCRDKPRPLHKASPEVLSWAPLCASGHPGQAAQCLKPWHCSSPVVLGTLVRRRGQPSSSWGASRATPGGVQGPQRYTQQCSGGPEVPVCSPCSLSSPWPFFLSFLGWDAHTRLCSGLTPASTLRAGSWWGSGL